MNGDKLNEMSLYRNEITRNIPEIVLENLHRHNIINKDLDVNKLKETILKSKEFFDFQVFKSEKDFEFESVIDKNTLDLSDLVSKIKKKGKKKKRRAKRT